MNNAADIAPTAAPILAGYLDRADWHGIKGWAFDPTAPDEPQWLEVVVGDAPPVAFLANQHRPDLVAAGYGSGNFGFELRFPVALDPGRVNIIDVRRRSDCARLANAPMVLHRAPMAEMAARLQFEAIMRAEMEAAQVAPDLDETIGVLLRQVDTLLDGRARLQSGATALHHFRERWNDYLQGQAPRPPAADTRPFVLLIAADLPGHGKLLTMLQAVQALGFRPAVLAAGDLAASSATARALEAMEVTVFGAPAYFTVEDVLRRHRQLFRAVLIAGPLLMAAYGLLVRLHQPRARLVALLEDLPPGRPPSMAENTALALSDHVVIETQAGLETIMARMATKSAACLDPEADADTTMALLEKLLPPVRRPVASPPSPPGG